ncbi:vacuolar membrane protein-domain-containing protein [Geranomyces variabilis]|nr:vacuolar membrane protein-domain-containing protein [Geranomyces variabilis]KAJ3133208.1 hypothetical protein HDU90_006364 [Geranomyces variabilis]
MATIALSSLIIKRHRERPQRPFKIWAFDTSKQAVAAGLVHFANILIASISGSQSEESENPCVWYFLNILLDTTLGVGILALILRGMHHIVDKLRIPDMRSGHYGNPPRLTAWARQLVLFLSAWTLVKLTVVILLRVFPFFAIVAEWILDPLVSSNDTRLQVVVVMLIFPLCMNVVQAWLIDMVIKGKPLRGGRGSARSSVTGNDDDNDNDNDDDTGSLLGAEDLIDDIDEHLGNFERRLSSDEVPKGRGAHSLRGGHGGRLARHGSGSTQPLLPLRSAASDGELRTSTQRGPVGGRQGQQHWTVNMPADKDADDGETGGHGEEE